MTDEERDELLRWAAEDALGWKQYWFQPEVLQWTTRDGEFHDPEDLLGWPGFGLAVEAIEKREYSWTLERATATTFGVEVYWHEDHAPTYVRSDDPAIAAWLALREALK